MIILKKLLTSNLLLATMAMLAISCGREKAHAQTTSQDIMEINITIDGKTMPVHLVDNTATQALVTILQEAAITYEADDYGGFEKVGSLGRSLPTSNTQLTTEAGDVILYNGNQIVLFYDKNSWDYTRLGHINYSSLNELKSFLKAGQGRISVTLSVAETTGVKQTVSQKQQAEKMYTLNGTALNKELMKGAFIKDGKKMVK
ncbi:MAG: hypothetical protein J1E37_04575 [Prevotella sp.]|nr:hypothetical protein [Prevotella sp.]